MFLFFLLYRKLRFFGQPKKHMFSERMLDNGAFEHGCVTTRSEDIETFHSSLVSKQVVFI